MGNECYYDCGFYAIGNCNDEKTKELIDAFHKMPNQAQGIILNYLFGCENFQSFSGQALWNFKSILLHGCESPIEYIYITALLLAYSFREKEMWEDNKDEDEYIKSASLDVSPQYEIVYGGRVYYADFVIAVDYMGTDIIGGQQHQDIVVECDGFQYHHSTKEQVCHDNARELEIKKAGFDVLRFSGTQIYNDPFGCANNTIDYVIAEMNRRCEEAV